MASGVETAAGKSVERSRVLPGADRSGAGPPRVRGLRRGRLRSGAVVVLPTVLTAALCLYELTPRSLTLDESASVAIASQHGAALGAAIAHDGGNMSGYYALLHVLIGVFGDGVAVLRLPSAIAATVTVALVCLLGLRLFGRRVALASGLLMAVSLPLVFWGQSARGYAPTVALVAASFLALVSIVDSDPATGVDRRAWLAYVVSTTLAVYASFVAVLVVPAQLLILAWRRRGLRPAAVALAVCAVCCAPLVALAANRGSSQLFWVPRPSLTAEKQVIEALTASSLEPSFRPTSTTAALLVSSTVVLAAVAGATVRAIARGTDRRAVFGPMLLLAWLVVPVAVAWLESSVGQSIFLPRNVLVSLPPVALLLAWGVAHPRVPGFVAWSSLTVLIALRALQLAPSYGTSPENWKAATSYVLARARASDCAAFYPSDARMAFGYYLGGRRPALRSVLPAAPWSQLRPYVEDYATLSGSELSSLPSTCPRLWLVSSHQGQPDATATSRANYGRYVRLRSALADEYGSGEAVSFGYASPVVVQLFGERR